MLKIDKLFIQNQDQSKSQAICFVSSPSESQEKLLGKLLITAKIEGTDKKDYPRRKTLRQSQTQTLQCRLKLQVGAPIY